MSSGDPLQQTATLSQNGTTDFLTNATTITVQDQPGTFGSSLINLGSPLLPVLPDYTTGNIVSSGPIIASGSSSNVLVSSGNLAINLEFDSNAVNAGTAFMSGIEQAASILVSDIRLSNTIGNTVTINLEIQSGESSIAANAADGGPLSGLPYTYANIRNHLTTNASGDANFSALPTGSSVTGYNGTTAVSYSSIDVWSAEEKALGLISGTASAVDGVVNFGTGIGTSELVGVALHELTHAMGRAPDGPTNPDVFDLFRFYSQGTILVSDASTTTAPAAYFSVDGGSTSIVAYGTSSDPSDFLNSSASTDPFAETYGSGTQQTLTALDLQQLDVLGFSTACFAEGTALATPNGPVLVERLRPGMKVLTVSGAIRPVHWLGYRRLDLTRHPAPEEVCPIRIRAGALGEGVPLRDLRLSPEHALYLDGGLVPVRLLVNNCSILRETACRHVVWYHVELDSHDLVLAEGAATETYLDTGNRGLFENAQQPLILHPDFSSGQAERVARSCAPLLDDPAHVEPIWRKLAERAAMAGFGAWATVATTADPGLALAMDGRLFRPVGAIEGRYVFVLPAVSGSVRLVSRTSAPSALRPWVADRRRLGVAVSQLIVRNGSENHAFAADDPALSDGWFAVEFEAAGPRRWTAGDAALPVQPGAPVVIEITCQPQAAYELDNGSKGEVPQAA